MRQLWTLTGIALMAGVTVACGSDDESSSSGGSGGSGGTGSGGVNVGGSSGTGGVSGTGGTAGSGGGDTDTCNSTFTATGTATPAAGDPIEVSLDESEIGGIEVVSGGGGNLRFEALYASDMPLEKAYMGPDYGLLIDILDAQGNSLEPVVYDELGNHGATLSIKYEAGMWHQFTLEFDSDNGDFVEIEEGSTPLTEIVVNPQIKAAYQLTFTSYTDMTGNTVDATGTLTGRFDGCYTRHNDASGKYTE